ncbi:LysR family transcriptional regulator [Asanoa iriomotensis]|uniref:LysR family transcriptional regulator n=1 Tax=Asanoa iriomotensis TaxID=234613 RepID=A0ABQ4BYI2_9ACTN|nr:LysR family transcriptional regulator [Asanoa iriomotensis]GIF55567.1 LysR family transcriptional regulator [Asanoa iriomotensis]
MRGNLGIIPLRSFVAVADRGGFQRAAASLHLTQGAVSQHVRRLEETLGRALVERHGRGSRFTPEGEALLGHARRILRAHDEALRALGVEADPTLVIGSTEHAADQLLPDLASELTGTFADYRIRFRIDRGAQLRSRLAEGSLDLALLIGPADEPEAQAVGQLTLTWYAAPGWRRPARDQPVPIAAFDAPCALRTRALETLAAGGVAAEVGAEAPHLAGVQAAVRAGLGIALMATLGQCPEGLVARDDLPAARPLVLSLSRRRGLPARLADTTAASVTRLLAATPLLGAA